jgi:hypothetical protein
MQTSGVKKKEGKRGKGDFIIRPNQAMSISRKALIVKVHPDKL